MTELSIFSDRIIRYLLYFDKMVKVKREAANNKEKDRKNYDTMLNNMKKNIPQLDKNLVKIKTEVKDLAQKLRKIEHNEFNTEQDLKQPAEKGSAAEARKMMEEATKGIASKQRLQKDNLHEILIKLGRIQRVIYFHSTITGDKIDKKEYQKRFSQIPWEPIQAKE